MFRNSQFEKLLDKATSHILMEPDWPSILQICDLIRQNDVQPKHVFSGVKKKLISPNPHTAMYALLVLESMVKNCGASVHEELTTKLNCEFLHELARTTPHENVRAKLLELIQAWTFAFRKNPKHGALKDTMNAMKIEGYKFPAFSESDAMFSADTAPEWADGDICHRCRVSFSLINRKHHCRACGQVFCGQCTSRSITLPKYGIEKEVRVCEACYEQATKPSSASKTASKSESELPPEYLKSSLAQQSQDPPKKSEDELREEEELQLALALSQSEAEAKEKEKFKLTSAAHSSFKAEPAERGPSPLNEQTNPELAKYLNRSYWESLQSTDSSDQATPASPSAPATAPALTNDTKAKTKENDIEEENLDEFIRTLKSQVEIFINRMKSNSSRGRSIANDTGVQTLFMNITAMHSRLLRYIQEHDDSRIYYERLQDKLAQVKDARAALDALREEHRERLQREAEEAERQRQLQMAHKLEIMRKKKQEYLQYQRQLALQRIQEQEREMHMRQEQQKQQYLMPQYGGYIGSPVHGQQFPPNSAPPSMGPYNYQYTHMMPMPSNAQLIHNGGMPQGPLPPQHYQNNPNQMGPPPGFPQGPPPMQQPTSANNNPQMPPMGQQQLAHHGMPPQAMMGPGMPHMGMPQQHSMPPMNQGMMPPNMAPMPQNQGMIPNQGGMPPNQGGMMPNKGGMTPNQSGMIMNQVGIPQVGIAPGMAPNHGGIPQGQGIPHQGQMPPQFQQVGAPPGNQQAPQNGETQTAELISFD